MNKLILTAACLLPALAGAQTMQYEQPAPAVQVITAAPERVTLPGMATNAWPMEYSQAMGTYRMEDGRSMRLSESNGRMYAKIDGMPRTWIVAVSPYVYAAPRRPMRISTDVRPSTVVATVEMTVPAGQGLAGATRVVTLLASR